MKKRVIFVDDDPNVLSGIRRMLRSRFSPGDWEMVFAESGPAALKLMEQQPFDVIVSDMRMPGMTGDQLLETVMKRYPQTIRFILSGYSDRELIMKSIGSTHQYLSKPCDADVLMAAIVRSVTIREILGKEHLKKLVAQIKVLPALPEPYLRVMEELKSPDAAAQKVGEIIARDLAMSSKILQLVNSAFFGLRWRVESPAQAVSLLGLDVVKSMTLMVKVFSTGSHARSGFSADWLWQHSLLAARCSQLISKSIKEDKNAMDDAFMAGLLHDLGMLVLAANLPEQYEQVLRIARETPACLLEAEERVLGATHCEVGAYLLGLWGFPDLMVEAALYHHFPGRSRVSEFTSLTTVHIANVLANEINPMDKQVPPPVFDEAYLIKLNVAHRVEEWRALCKKTALEGDGHA